MHFKLSCTHIGCCRLAIQKYVSTSEVFSSNALYKSTIYITLHLHMSLRSVFIAEKEPITFSFKFNAGQSVKVK